MEEEMITRKDAARILGVEPDTLSAWISTKKYDLLPIKVRGNRVYYRLTVLLDFFKVWDPLGYDEYKRNHGL